jgi:heterodisulfide reductase subunit B
MKTYAYYPGCSLETMAASYHLSAVETANKLGIQLKEVEDWNCCGATPYSHIDELLAKVLCARNLAIAEKDKLDLVAPCSGCYRNMYFANEALKRDADLLEHMNFAMEEDNLHYSGTIGVYHLMHVFVDHVGLEGIRKQVTHPLKDLRVAPYYGCHLVRPRKEKQSLEDVGDPRLFENLISALGAVPVHYPQRLRCCGGSLIATNRKAALGMLRDLLQSAAAVEADVIATACPLCQINLELYQGEVNREYGTELAIPVMYFTQLMGLAMGLGPKSLGIGKEMVPPTKVLACRQPQA